MAKRSSKKSTSPPRAIKPAKKAVKGAAATTPKGKKRVVDPLPGGDPFDL